VARVIHVAEIKQKNNYNALNLTRLEEIDTRLEHDLSSHLVSVQTSSDADIVSTLSQYRVFQISSLPITFWNIFTPLRLTLFAGNFANLLAIHTHIYVPIFVDLSQYFINGC